jgi:hypothetical protein
MREQLVASRRGSTDSRLGMHPTHSRSSFECSAANADVPDGSYPVVPDTMLWRQPLSHGGSFDSHSSWPGAMYRASTPEYPSGPIGASAFAEPTSDSEPLAATPPRRDSCRSLSDELQHASAVAGGACRSCRMHSPAAEPRLPPPTESQVPTRPPCLLPPATKQNISSVGTSVVERREDVDLTGRSEDERREWCAT